MSKLWPALSARSHWWWKASPESVGRGCRTGGCSDEPLKPQSTNSMPSLKVALVCAHHLGFVEADAVVEFFMCGSVASPTPTVPISSDSTSRTLHLLVV